MTKKELPKNHPARLKFEEQIRRLNPDVLFIKRWGKIDPFGHPTGILAGKYTNVGIQTMWQGYQLGYQDGIDQMRDKLLKPQPPTEGFT